MKNYILYPILLLFFLVISCGGKEESEQIEIDTRGQEMFKNGVTLGQIDSEVDEASGLGASISNPGFLWTHNDSGDDPKIYLINTKAEVVWTILLNGIDNKDVEDIAIGPGPIEGANYIYLGDIGDNEAKYNSRHIYRIQEPVFIESEHQFQTTLINNIDIIEYKYPDGPRDSETLLINPFTKDLYIVTKREAQVHLYTAKFPQETTNVITLQKLGDIPYYKIVAGDFSPINGDVILKTYNTIFYWEYSDSLSLLELLNSEPIVLPYTIESQGEAITWKSDGNGYYTLSEKTGFSNPDLYFYEKK